nr:hypothetical protein [Tanacetum cinerariifolium]
MLESKAYKIYYAFASREKTPKPKYIRKKADSDTSPNQKPVQATKGTRIKTKAKVTNSDKKKQLVNKPKAKGLAVLSEVTEAKQLKLATKRSKTRFYSSHASGSVTVYNDALTSKSDFSTEPVEIPYRIDKFDLKDGTSLSKYDEEEQNVLYFNDLFL